MLKNWEGGGGGRLLCCRIYLAQALKYVLFWSITSALTLVQMHSFSSTVKFRILLVVLEVVIEILFTFVSAFCLSHFNLFIEVFHPIIFISLWLFQVTIKLVKELSPLQCTLHF